MSQDDAIERLDAVAKAAPVVVRLRGIVAELRELVAFYKRHRLVDRLAEGPEDEIESCADRIDDATDEIEGRI